jgi:hypothetical protein
MPDAMKQKLEPDELGTINGPRLAASLLLAAISTGTHAVDLVGSAGTFIDPNCMRLPEPGSGGKVGAASGKP